MNKTRKIIHGAALLLILLLSANVVRSSEVTAIKLSKSSNTHALAEGFFGFNENLSRGNFTYTDKEHLAQLTALAPQSLRFPGGTYANFYHWKQGGADRSEVKKVPDKRLRNTMLFNLKQLNMDSGKVVFDDFMSACQQAGLQAYVVLNLYLGSPEESAGWVKYAQSKGYDIAGWELGNELYMGAYKDKFPNVNAYIKVAKKHVAAIRAVDKNARVGIVAAPFSLVGSKKGQSYKQAWNQAVAREHFYDAYVVHHYFGFPEKKDMNFSELKDYVFALSEEMTTKRMDYYRMLFGSKDMWVTEWNWMGFKQKKANNTHLNALFVADMFIQLLVYPEIKVSMYHQIASAGSWPALFYDARSLLARLKNTEKLNHKLPKDCKPNSRCVLRNSTYYPFWLIGQSIKDVNQVIVLETSGVPIQNYHLSYYNKRYDFTYPTVKAIGLGKNGIVKQLLFSNRSRLPVQVDTSELFESKGSPKKNINLQCITSTQLEGESLSSKSPADNPVQKHIQVFRMAAGKVQVPPYAFCIAHAQ
jgi:hypothetical protein